MVVKEGRTTGVTNGLVIYTDAEVEVAFGEGRRAYFTDQYVLSCMSRGGDSGSAICRETPDGLYVGGLLFAGSDKVTIANRIEHVTELLDIVICRAGVAERGVAGQYGQNLELATANLV